MHINQESYSIKAYFNSYNDIEKMVVVSDSTLSFTECITSMSQVSDVSGAWRTAFSCPSDDLWEHSKVCLSEAVGGSIF